MSDDSFAGDPHDCPPGILSDTDEVAIAEALRRRTQEIDEGHAVPVTWEVVWKALQERAARASATKSG